VYFIIVQNQKNIRRNRWFSALAKKNVFPKVRLAIWHCCRFPNRVLPEMAYICCLSNIITLSMFYFMYEK